MLSTTHRSALAWQAGLVALLALAPARVDSGQRAKHRGKQEAAPEIFNVYRTETIHFSAPSPTVAPWGYKCDADGDIYAAYAASLGVLSQPGAIGQLPISRISTASKKVRQYPLPQIPGYQRLFRWSFDVSPDGTVYALINTGRKDSEGKIKPVFLIVKYNDDGTVDSHIKVGSMLGKRIQPLRMAVFADGDFLLSGTLPGKGGLGTFAGIFDRQGTFIAPLRLGGALARAASPRRRAAAGSSKAKAAKPPLKNAKQKLWPQGVPDKANPVGLESSTLSVSSQDGNIYVLQGTSAAMLYVVEPTGEIVRRFALKPPEPGMSPLQMAPAGVGYLFIYYGRLSVAVTNKKPAKPDYITVLNSETGKLTAVYRLAGKGIASRLAACADSPDDFLFLGTSKDNHLEVVRYAAR